MLALAFTALALAASAPATPLRRQDNGACAQLLATCAGAVAPSLQDAWGIESCVLGATCFGGQRPVDGFLAALWGEKNGGAGGAPRSADLPRVAGAVLAALSTDGATVSQQNFIDGFYGQLALTGGPWPASADIVISYFDRVDVWTGFCGAAVPFFNFADYFQWSASVSSPGCAAAA